MGYRELVYKVGDFYFHKFLDDNPNARARRGILVTANDCLIQSLLQLGQSVTEFFI